MIDVQKLLSDAASLGLEIKISLEDLTCGLYKPTPKAKINKTKKLWAWRFKSQDQMFEYASKDLAARISNKAHDEEMKAKRKTENDVLAASIAVGDVFVASWGFEQTNINFYQVVARKGKSSVVLREIAKEDTREGGWASAYTKPLVDVFVGDEETHRLIGDWVKFKSFMYAHKTDSQKEHYRSWYA
jgi:hypothetical protein